MIKNRTYQIRNAQTEDASALEKVRLHIDGETENMDREQGEAYLDESDFETLIATDMKNEKNLFLVAEVAGEIVGFARCEGTTLKRKAHVVEFGVCVLKKYWGLGIGKALLSEAVHWAEESGIRKMMLFVLETNKKALEMYKRNGFEVEGILKDDKFLSDGNYYNTVMMSRFFSR